uniref:Replication factor A3 n=1 Tax=Tetraselmis sp. GSL018 TaxID=582737 RepID=A0A061S1Z6_9CHLO|mmetsp:Transcript_27352/g.64791  ORF Transcript_27352/g.64791 Transcript_27352/m.64791 type:complete len:108 (+) Transcript_27352:111-434(+)|eukprot:CAMPEP_0177600080 /NCGR_PEP_ID=MMETSP0419_2-20121207/13398_1 /TAXON_ID=582737 /ORGANISM="Tetraselmis sp., Strain GSL018" /LENGTH=107 /DNA_ID=CAMNT_0019092981 /DNA_START=44 /DNA_END=367 /DNA_ORIENTATION=-
MDTSNPTPRVNGALLRHHIGRKVLLVGEVLSLEEGYVRMLGSDQVPVTVKVNDKSPFQTKYAEVLGLVDGENSVVAEQHIPFGDNFELNNYNELVLLSNSENRSLFC